MHTPDDVTAFLARLEHPLKAEIEAVRALILGADPRIHECIKWNAPSFATTEYFATFKLRPIETVQVVLHTRAKAKPPARPIRIDDPAGLLRWAAADRCGATCSDRADITAKSGAFVAIVRQWIAQV
jgi:hypothetical protein